MATDYNTDDRGPAMMGVNTAFCVTAGIIVLLRCYVRAVMVKAFGADDWIMVLATVFFTIFTTMSNLGISHGTGRHEDSLTPGEIFQATKYWWFCYIFFSLTMIAAKLSFALFLLRVVTSRLHAWIVYLSAAGTVVAGAVFFFVSLLQCHPISYYWDKNQDGTCIPIEIIMALAYVYSVFSIITDFTFAILPCFVIWQLNLKMRSKAALTILITMGCVASAAVVVRCGYLVRFKNPDFLWATADIAIWSAVEMGLAISSASLATLRPLAKLVATKLGLTTTGPKYGTELKSGNFASRAKPNTLNQVYVVSEFSQKRTSHGGSDEWDIGHKAAAYADRPVRQKSSRDKERSESQETLS